MLRLALAGAAVGALLATTGCAAWRIGEAKDLAKASEPFEQSPSGATGSVLVVGDSTAVGTGASSPAASVAGLIGADHPRLRIVNRAEDGAKFEQVVQQLENAPGRYGLVLVLAGGNDVIRLTGEDKLRGQIERAATLAREKGDTVVFLPSGNVGNAPFFFPPTTWLMTRRSEALHAIVREATSSRGEAYVNLYKSRADDPFAQRPKELHAADGLHPSDAGYRIWYSELNAQAGLQQKLAALDGKTRPVAAAK